MRNSLTEPFNMNKSEDLLERLFMPILFLFQLTGMEAMPYPHSINGNKIFRFVWNSPKYAFQVILFLNVVTQSMWLVFVSRRQSDWAMLIITLLQMSVYISLLRSREKIRLLLKKLSKISKLFLSARRWRILKISMIIYCLIIFIMFIINQIGYVCTKAKKYQHCQIQKSATVPEELKEHFFFITDILWISTVVMTYGIVGCFVGYYFFLCICLKSCFTKFILKSESLILQCDYQRILSIYEDISQVMALANEFLSYPAFIIVLCNTSAVFGFSYRIAFHPSNDIKIYSLLIYGVLQNIIVLLLLMIPAAGCNRALNKAQDTVKSLPGWLPQHRKVLKMYYRQKHRKTFPMTLWNIYVIDESLLISIFGTILTYGFLVGNIKISN
ncbi:uncharacterized protein NPIL_172191 [Nephila pilipes]|uniref:Uncharacterized protein n=1 Tax=Nephila pilipes TaxID=299642 RepID=A0A8X6MSP6_NEPPI|nr:uncharacterized protein NPIL_172191 [Nephila pilipes]